MVVVFEMGVALAGVCFALFIVSVLAYKKVIKPLLTWAMKD